MIESALAEISVLGSEDGAMALGEQVEREQSPVAAALSESRQAGAVSSGGHGVGQTEIGDGERELNQPSFASRGMFSTRGAASW